MPILVIFFGAFKTGTEFNSTGAFDLPKVWQFKNFLTVWQKGDMGRAFLNTIIMIGLTCAGSIMTGTMASYVLHRFDFKGKKLIKNLFLWIVLIPGTTAQVARFQIVNALGLYNTMACPIILALGTDIMAIYIYLQFLDSIPVSLESEFARVWEEEGSEEVESEATRVTRSGRSLSSSVCQNPRHVHTKSDP